MYSYAWMTLRFNYIFYIRKLYFFIDLKKCGYISLMYVCIFKNILVSKISILTDNAYKDAKS